MTQNMLPSLAYALSAPKFFGGKQKPLDAAKLDTLAAKLDTLESGYSQLQTKSIPSFTTIKSIVIEIFWHSLLL